MISTCKGSEETVILIRTKDCVKVKLTVILIRTKDCVKVKLTVILIRTNDCVKVKLTELLHEYLENLDSDGNHSGTLLSFSGPGDPAPFQRDLLVRYHDLGERGVLGQEVRQELSEGYHCYLSLILPCKHLLYFTPDRGIVK